MNDKGQKEIKMRILKVRGEFKSSRAKTEGTAIKYC